MKKICFVVQRYGPEVNGGAELLCRQLAERMTKYCRVTVFTTKAVDYMTWKDEYTKSEEILNGVHVCRFSVKRERNRHRFNKINYNLMNGLLNVDQEKRWFIEQGPYVPKLIQALEEHEAEFDAFIFNTYLYYPTVFGVPAVRRKAILIPDMHDEPFLRMKLVRREICCASAIMYNTEEERELVCSRFHVKSKPSVVGGAGVLVPENVSAESFREKYQISDPYVIYVGRIDEGKGCDVMFRYWSEYKRRHPGPVKLVLMGKSAIFIPQRDDIVTLGFVPEEDKFAGIAGAEFLLLPSWYESLSIIVLEAMSLGVPVLVNGWCDVLKGHCVRSNAGLYYRSFEEFEAAASFLLSDRPQVEGMRRNGPVYVKENYQWDVILKKLLSLVDGLEKVD